MVVVTVKVIVMVKPSGLGYKRVCI